MNRVKRTHYVYELLKPDGTVFYVGRSQHGLSLPRKKGHTIEALRGDPSSKCEIIREILASGQDFTERIVYETDNEINIVQFEWAMIYLIYGVENLSNGFHYASGRISQHLGRKITIQDVERLQVI